MITEETTKLEIEPEFDTGDDEVEIVYRENRLKEKFIDDDNWESAQGFVDPKAVKRAQAVIDDGEDAYIEATADMLEQLIAYWKGLQETEPDKIDTVRDEFYVIANQLKELASTYNYELMDYFSESLRDFVESLDITQKAHHTIVQAHIDVMMITFQTKIKEDTGEKAQELKEVLTQAIAKYS